MFIEPGPEYKARHLDNPIGGCQYKVSSMPIWSQLSKLQPWLIN